MEFKFDIVPLGAVRMTKRGKFVKENAKRYLAYKEFIKTSATQQVKGEFFEEGPIGVNIIFTMPIPPSWSQKKQREAVGRYHTNTPDIDNLIKGVFDSLNKVVWKDDKQLVS